MASLRKPRPSIRGEKLANVLLLACCYQEVSVRQSSNGLEAPMTLRPTSVAGSYSQYRHKPIKVSRRYGAPPLAGPFALQHTHSVAPHAGQSRCPKVHATASMTRRTRAVRLARPPGMVTAGTSGEERLAEPTRRTFSTFCLRDGKTCT